MLPRQSAGLALLRRLPAVQRLGRIAGPVATHLVGGAVRDRMLGLPVGDLDAVVERRGREIATRLADELGARFVALGGKQFAAYRVVGPGLTLDLWDRDGTALEQDLARRDFTVNAMALALSDGRLIDPYDGERDIGLRALRATTTASFSGDPLRVLRLARLLVQLPGFAIDPATLELGRAAAEGVAEMAAERVREELRLLLLGPEAHRGVAALAQLGVYPGLWLGQPGRHVDASAAARAILRLEHLAGCALAVREAGGEVDLPTARATLLLRSLGESPVAVLRRMADAGYATQRQSAEIAPLLDWSELPLLELEQRVFLHRAGTRWATAAAAIGACEAVAGRSAAWQRTLVALATLLRREGATLISPQQLLSGGEVQDLLGLPPGPAIGEALRRVRDAQVSGRVQSADEARRLLLAARPHG